MNQPAPEETTGFSSTDSQRHNTPDAWVLSIADFEDFCRDRELQVDRRSALDTQFGVKVDSDPNLNADVGIFLLRR
jgi:hypothetical protein